MGLRLSPSDNHTGLQLCRLAVMPACSYAGLQLCRLAVMEYDAMSRMTLSEDRRAIKIKNKRAILEHGPWF
jgi:hypothetical protein